MKSSFKVFPTVSIRRTSTSTSAGTGAPEAKEKSFLFGVLQKFVKCDIAAITFWIALSLFLTWAASWSLCFPDVWHSGSLIIPETSSILSNNLALADVVRIQRWYTAKLSNIPCFHLHKNQICLSVILYCGTIIGFYLMAIVGNFMG